MIAKVVPMFDDRYNNLLLCRRIGQISVPRLGRGISADGSISFLCPICNFLWLTHKIVFYMPDMQKYFLFLICKMVFMPDDS